MESNVQEKSDSKAGFRKPLNDAANRKYRRRSPVGGSSSSSDGSPQRSSSPAPLPKYKEKISDAKQTRNDGREIDRTQPGRRGESYKLSDRQSSRNYDRYDDRSRHDKHVDEYDRGYSKASYRSGRDSRDSGYSRADRELRAKDYLNDAGKHSREKYDASRNRSRDRISPGRAGSGRRHATAEDRDRDEDRVRHREGRGGRDRKTDHRSYGDQKYDHSPAYEDRNVPPSRRDSSSNHLKKASPELYDDQRGYKEPRNREPEVHSDDVKPFSSKDSDPGAKKPRLSKFDNTGSGTNGTSEQACVTDSDIDAAKVAAMKAAELVNKNLVGTGYMSADQKKKLLWGNKKTTTTEEPSHHWNSAIFGDRERQEKFNKLMGVKGDHKVENQLDDPDTEKQRQQLQLELEKQYTAGLRRKDGRTVGLGL